MVLDASLIENVERASIRDGIAMMTSAFPGQVVFSSSLGQEDQVLTDIIFRNDLPVKIFTIDTGRLFNETYELLDRTQARYKKPIQVFFPDNRAVEELVSEQGINGFYESVENRKACCGVRKIHSLDRALAGARVWITGLRSEQSAFRQNMPMVEWSPEKQLYKFNPLLNWSMQDMLEHLRAFDVPYNPMHDRGFISIGCAPCTRAIGPGEDARAGRWWWESSQKECGLHARVVEAK